MTINNLENTIVAINDQIAYLELLAEECEVVARHFRTRFELCWETGTAGKGALRDQATALRLRPFVIDRESDARRLRAEACVLQDALKVLYAACRGAQP